MSTLFVELLGFDSPPSPVNHICFAMLLPFLDFLVYNLPLRAATVLFKSPMLKILSILGFADHLLA